MFNYRYEKSTKTNITSKAFKLLMVNSTKEPWKLGSHLAFPFQPLHLTLGCDTNWPLLQMLGSNIKEGWMCTPHIPQANFQTMISVYISTFMNFSFLLCLKANLPTKRNIEGAKIDYKIYAQ